MPKHSVTYNEKDLAELLKRQLLSEGKRLVGEVTFTITPASSDGPFYSAASVTCTAQYEDIPRRVGISIANTDLSDR